MKKHEREIETLLILAAGPWLQFNTQKKRLTISSGNIRDYEAGDSFLSTLLQKREETNGLRRALPPSLNEAFAGDIDWPRSPSHEEAPQIPTREPHSCCLFQRAIQVLGDLFLLVDIAAKTPRAINKLREA